MSAVIQNQKDRRVVARAIANVTLQMSDLALSGQETVNGAGIVKVWWNGNTSIQRGSNTIMAMGTGTGGFYDFAGNGISLNEFPSANITLTVNDAFSWICVELSKQTTSNTVY